MDIRSSGRRTAVGITTAIGISSLAVTGILSGVLFAGTATARTSGTTGASTGTSDSGSGGSGSSSDSGSGSSSSGSGSSSSDSGSGIQQSQGGGFSGRSSGS